MERFSRFKLLRALWARARALLAWLHVPQQQQLRARMQYWQHVNIAERQLRDGIVRSTGDPDAFVLYERYRDQGAFEAHTTSPHYEGIAVAQIRPLLTDRTLEFCQVITPDE